MKAVVILPLILALGCAADSDSSPTTAVQSSPATLAAAPGSASESGFKGKWYLTVSIPQDGVPFPIGVGDFGVTMECEIQPNGLGSCGHGNGALRLVTTESHGQPRVMMDVPAGVLTDRAYFFTAAPTGPVGTGPYHGTAAINQWITPSTQANPVVGGLKLSRR